MNAAKLQQYAADPAAFRDALLIDADVGRVKFGDIMDPFQRSDFAKMDGAWLFATGRADHCDGPQRAYLERPRGHSKTQDVATMAVWSIAFARRQISGICAAGTRDQARLLRDSIARIVRANEWLREAIEILNYKVTNKRTGSSLEIIAADASHAYGHLVDFIVIDELGHWGDCGEDLWHALFSAAAKRKHCVVTIITNAGFGQGTSWQWKVREACRESNLWYFSRLDGPQASWICAELLAEQQALLPPSAYQRLWLNEWTSGSSDCLTNEQIDAALMLDGPSPREDDWSYVCGVDLGLTHDATAIAVVGKSATSYKVARIMEWRPPRGGKVSVDEIEEAIVKLHKQYRFARIAVDPWNAAQLVERCRRKHQIPITERQQSGKNLTDQASALIECFTSGSIQIYDHESLLFDLRHLRLEEKSYGYRIVSDRGPSGHGDRASALSISLATARDIMATHVTHLAEPWWRPAPNRQPGEGCIHFF